MQPRNILATGLLLALVLLLPACGNSNNKNLSLLERIKKSGELIVITRNAPTTYYEGPHGEYKGFEYDLAKLFAAHLRVRLKIITPDSFNEILPTIIRGEAHIAAAGLTVTEKRKKLVRFGPSYQEITQQLVYRSGTKRPRSLDKLNGSLEVVAGSSHVENLKLLVTKHPALKWKINENTGSDELLHLVWQQLIDYTIADSNEVTLNRRFYPELRVAFNISKPEKLAWAFRYSDDDSLYREAERFFDKIRKNGTLEQLHERYYGHAKGLDYVNTRLYIRHIKTRLPRFRKLFEEAGKKYKIDWRLLAAIGYQESHWRPRAKSPTGVRGIMMLTQQTAKQLNIRNRLDPRSSIMGGAQYLKFIFDNIPKQLKEPDRTWMALASYNIGRGHLEDARKLAQKRGGDPNKWVDVKKNLPLLSIRRWYKQTKHGYARGREPVLYVERVRSYYDLLVWVIRNEPGNRRLPRKPLKSLDSPIL